MKKLVSLLLLLTLTGCAPAVGATTSTAPERVTVQIKVDNRDFATADGVVIDGQVYLPAWQVAEAVGAETVTEGQTINVYPHRNGGVPQVDENPQAFYTNVTAALNLLKAKAPDNYKTVAQYVSVVIPGAFNAAYGVVDAVTVSREMWEDGPEAVAAVLAHEAEHLRIYHTDPALYANEKENERQAYRQTLAVFQAIGAPQAAIQQAEEYVQDPPTAEDVMK